MKILLTDWASRHYDPPPSLWTLRQWARNGEIYPPPQKCGKSYYVEETAERMIAHGPTLVQRLRAA